MYRKIFATNSIGTYFRAKFYPEMSFRYFFPVVLLLCTFEQNSRIANIAWCWPGFPKQETRVNNSYAGKSDRTVVDFFASGEQPAWTLEIDFGNLIHFYSAQAGSVYMPVPLPEKDESNGKVTYASSGTQKIQITIQAVACGSHRDDSGFTYKVEVRHQNKTYTGCGQYFFPAERLHDIWALEELNQRKVAATEFSKGIPMLEIFVLEQKVLGNTGCNTFSGRVILEKENIRFTEVAASEMACAGSLEKEFLQALAKTDVYRLESGKLVLFKGKSQVLQFKKVD